MKDKIKIGIIGAGENTRKFHIPNFQKLNYQAQQQNQILEKEEKNFNPQSSPIN